MSSVGCERGVTDQMKWCMDVSPENKHSKWLPQLADRVLTHISPQQSFLHFSALIHVAGLEPRHMTKTMRVMRVGLMIPLYHTNSLLLRAFCIVCDGYRLLRARRLLTHILHRVNALLAISRCSNHTPTEDDRKNLFYPAPILCLSSKQAFFITKDPDLYNAGNEFPRYCLFWSDKSINSWICNIQRPSFSQAM